MMDLKRILLRSMRELKVDEPQAISVKAASGLVKSGGNFFVIADDELSLFEFNFEGLTHAKSLTLKSGELPQNAKDRKKQKPDWEALVKLNLTQADSVLLAVPSGSTENRLRGAFVKLNPQGLIDPLVKVSEADFSKLYAALKEKLPELNIEGACVLNNKFKLLQRGNGASGVNAIIDLDFEGFCNDLIQNTAIDPKNITAINTYDLGSLDRYKLDFTDACAVGDSMWFIAVAEDSQSTYEDGKYHGAIIGCLDSSGREIARYEIDCALKPEGLWVEAENNRLSFYVVTDADSPTINAAIYYGKLIL